MRKILTVAVISLKESLRNKSIYVIFALALVFIFIGRGCNPANVRIMGAGVGDLNFHTIALQIAFHVIVFWGMVLSALLSMNAVSREVEEKTILVILARPISRGAYAAGKLLGILTLAALNLFVLGIIFFVLFYAEAGKADPGIFAGFALTLVSMALISIIGLILSFYLPGMAVAVLAVFVYLASLLAEVPVYFTNFGEPSTAITVLNALLPGFGRLQFTCASLISGAKTPADCVLPALYLVLYGAVLYPVLLFVFGRKEL